MKKDGGVRYKSDIGTDRVGACRQTFRRDHETGIILDRTVATAKAYNAIDLTDFQENILLYACILV